MTSPVHLPSYFLSLPQISLPLILLSSPSFCLLTFILPARSFPPMYSSHAPVTWRVLLRSTSSLLRHSPSTLLERSFMSVRALYFLWKERMIKYILQLVMILFGLYLLGNFTLVSSYFLSLLLGWVCGDCDDGFVLTCQCNDSMETKKEQPSDLKSAQLHTEQCNLCVRALGVVLGRAQLI